MNCPRKFLIPALALALGGAAITIVRAQDSKDQAAAPSLKNPGAPVPQTPSAQTPAPQAQTPEPQDPRGKIVQRVSVVVVPVTVKNSAGELVTDLQQNDFRVFEDGAEQPIELFSVDAFPLSAAILIVQRL